MLVDKQTVLDAFDFRHACKSYGASKKISAEDFDFILESACLSSSSFGLGPQRFLATQNPELRGEIHDISWGASKIMDYSYFVILLARAQRAMQADYQRRIWGGVHHIPPETTEIMEKFFKNFNERDFATAENPRTFYDWVCKQTYIALANMMIAAAFIGIDSVPVEGLQLDEANSLSTEKELMDPDEHRISVMVAFGYRSREPKRAKTRQTATDIIQWVEQAFDPLPAKGRLKSAPLLSRRSPNVQIQRFLGLCYTIPLPESKENTVYEVNRSVFLLIPLEPFWNWLQSLPGNYLDSLTLEDIQADANSYLMRSCETADEVWDEIETHFEDIFVAELADWYEDEREWPDLDADIFNGWFDIQLPTVITDPEYEPLVHEAFQPINLN